jgi:CspA family cold shock protein
VRLAPRDVARSLTRSDDVQGVIKSYDPATGDGVVVRDDADLAEFDLAAGALDGSVFRMLRQGQRVCFDLDAEGFATTLRLGSEVDMRTPRLSASDEISEPVAEQRELHN